MRSGNRKPSHWLWPILLLASLSAILWASSVGAVSIAWTHTATWLADAIGLPVASQASAAEERILGAIRLPRVLVAYVTGALLATAGVLLQGTLRTRLAEPATMGTAAGALLGATVAVAFAAAGAGSGLLDRAPTTTELVLRLLVAAAAAWAATWIVVQTAGRAGSASSGPLLTAGLAVNAVVGSLAAGVLFLGSIGAQTAATVVTGWVFGGLLSQSSTASLAAAGVVALAVIVGGWLGARAFDLLAAGEESAAASGLDVTRTRQAAIALAALATGAAVTVAGILAFVGLLAPATIARWTGPQHRSLLPAGALSGGVLVCLADAAGRWIAAPAELSTGVVTALIGAPVLLAYLRRSLRSGEAAL